MKTLSIVIYFLTAVSTTTFSNFSKDHKFAVLQQSKDVKIEGMGVKRDVEMNGGTLTVEGADCEIRLKGFADRIEVEGANVKVNADAVNFVKIEGANTFVYYRTTKNKNGKVASSVFGMNSGVKKLK